MYKGLHHAVIYARFSSHLQREESITAQVRAVREFAIRQHMVIVGEYIDRGKSATTDQRPQFLMMIEDACKGMFDTLLVHKYDRFARNRKDSGYTGNCFIAMVYSSAALLSTLHLIYRKPRYSNRSLMAYRNFTAATCQGRCKRDLWKTL